jgi:hypothetical protein
MPDFKRWSAEKHEHGRCKLNNICKKGERKVGQVDGLLSSKLRGKVSPEDGCLSLMLPCCHLKVNDLLMDLFLWLQDRSLAFHELCALYASTGTFALSASMMPSLRFTNSSCGACHASLCCPVVVEIYRWWWGWAFFLGADVALVTSLRDGMNLVSYEYVACQNSKKTEGVLVLSEVSNCGFWNLNMSSMGTCLI